MLSSTLQDASLYCRLFGCSAAIHDLCHSPKVCSCFCFVFFFFCSCSIAATFFFPTFCQLNVCNSTINNSLAPNLVFALAESSNNEDEHNVSTIITNNNNNNDKLYTFLFIMLYCTCMYVCMIILPLFFLLNCFALQNAGDNESTIDHALKFMKHFIEERTTKMNENETQESPNNVVTPTATTGLIGKLKGDCPHHSSFSLFCWLT